MVCKNCNNFQPIANTDTTGKGICKSTYSYFPVDCEAECVFAPKPYVCGNCNHFQQHDPACMSCQEDDSAYRHGHLCGGFEDVYEVQVLAALADWELRGYDLRKKLDDVYGIFQRTWEVPWSRKND